MTQATTLISFGLLSVWGVIAVRLARRAERRITALAPPAPWASAVAVASIAFAASGLSSYADAAACGIACIALAAVAGPDVRTGYIFDAVTLPAAVLLIAIALGRNATAAALLGAGALVIPFGAIVVFSGGRLMGLGDVKAMFVLGAAFGPRNALLAVVVACASATVVHLACAAMRRNPGRREIPFGPYLAFGAAAVLVAIQKLLLAPDVG